MEEVTHTTVSGYIDHLMRKRMAPKTVNCHLDGIRQFYYYLREEEGIGITNPVKRDHHQKMSRPLPRYLRDEQVNIFFNPVKEPRDRAIFMLMLRCGLRVEEVANLTLGVIDVNRRTILVEDGKGGKDRVVYMSHDALESLAALSAGEARIESQKNLPGAQGTLYGAADLHPGHPEEDGVLCEKSEAQGLLSSARHTMATQMLNADADLCTIQDLLGHTNVKTTQRYCRISNLKVQRDYFNAMEVIRLRTIGRTG